MACGTPVIAFNRGSVPEVIDHGLTGYIVEDVQGAVAALQRIDDLSRDAIRAQFEKRFSAKTMAQNYVDGYMTLVEAQRRPILRRVAAAG
jgi:glycosyltransferase involved in cell wall biosynthesis